MTRLARRQFLLLAVFVFLSATVGLMPTIPAVGNDKVPEANAVAQKSKPNIVFIFADDQCYDTIGALGNAEIKTPHLDQLAKQGVSFSNAYNMGSWTGAVCVASRTMLNTGRFVWRARQADLKTFSNDGLAWSQLLSANGYETYMSGKWHVGGLNTKTLFDHVLHQRPGMPNQTPAGYWRPQTGETDAWSPHDPKFEGFWKGGKHWSEVLGNDATGFIKSAAEKDKPFFMYLAFNAPHDPRQAPKEFVDLYPSDKIRIPDNFLPEYPYKQEMKCYETGRDKNGNPNYLRDEKLAPWPRTKEAVQLHRQEYYAIISHMDQQIGRILKALKETNQSDNTYIFFTADHGLACGQHGLLGKQNMYEHSMKPPLIISGPNLPRNEKRDALVYMQDIMPTTLELTNTPIPAHIEFKSLGPHLHNAEQPDTYPAIYGCYLKKAQRMIRVGDWKLIYYPEAQAKRLYNLKSDPWEISDLAKLPSQKKRVDEMMKQLIEVSKQMDDPLDLAMHSKELLESNQQVR